VIDAHLPWRALELLASTCLADEGEGRDLTAKSLSLMTELARGEGGLERLVSTFADARSPLLHRPLSYLLADRCGAEPNPNLLDLVAEVAKGPDATDVTTQTNLLTALHYLAMVDSVKAEQMEWIGAFIHSGLASEPAAASAALGLLVRLREDGLLDSLSAAGRRLLRRDIGRLSTDSHPLIQLELAPLLDLIGEGR